MTSDKLHNYFSGNCSEEEILFVKEWAESSDENMKSFQRERVLYDILLLHGDTRSSSSIDIIETPTKKVKLWWNLAKVASILLITLISIYVTQYIVYEDLNTSLQTINVPAGQYISMELPDGSKVWINAQTTIKYPPVFNHKKRHVFLDGEAYFQVTKNKDIPFEVETDKGFVRVLGTEFNVKSYSTDNEFTTSLLSGEVEVGLKGSDERIVMKPNTTAMLQAGVLKVDPIENYNSYTWKDGILTFTNVSFAEMMDKFERIYGVDLIVDNEEVMKHRYTGKFRIVEGVDYALLVLQKSIAFKYVNDPETNKIYIR